MAPSGEPIRVFVTVGSQLPFDRLVAATAAWVRTQPLVEITAQVGASALDPRSLAPIQVVDQLAPKRYAQRVHDAHLIVAHAGMGSILTAMETNKTLVVMPRRGHLRETRNDHQFDTAMHLSRQQSAGLRSCIHVAMAEWALPLALNQALRDISGSPPKGSLGTDMAHLASNSHIALIRSLRKAIEGSRLV